MTSPLNISVSGLLAFQRALTTVSHNISNANTDGYTRQRVELEARPPQGFGNGYVGQGVYIQNTERITDQYLNLQLQQNIAESNRLDTFYSLSSQIDSLLSEGQGGLSPVIQDFFNSVQGVANDPSSSTSRTVMLSSANSVSDRFQFVANQLDSKSRTLNMQLEELVLSVNGLAQNIASVNEDIILAIGQASGKIPNDLLDQRENLINKLSELISVTTVEEGSGAVNVFIGKGQSLVVGANYRSLATIQDPENFTQLQVVYQSGSGNQSIDNQLTGGQIGGLLEFRSNVLLPTQNELGRIATVLADTFNSQHRDGMDLTNSLGGNFFNVPTPTTIVSLNNTGTGTVTTTITDVTQMSSSNYRLTYDGATYTLTRLSDNTSVTGAGPFAIDGLSIAIAAGANAGDSFLIQPTFNALSSFSVAVTDTNRIAAAAPVRSEAISTNLSDAVISPGVVTDVTNVDLLDTVDIVFNNPPTDFDILNITDSTTISSAVAYTSGNTISFNGIDVSISGTPVAGDRFRIQQNTAGAADGRNALLLADLQTQSLIGGTRSYQESYAGWIGQVGTLTNQSEINGKAQNALLTEAREARDNVSGVNLDEEAANLLKYQQAYQAAAQVVATAESLFQTLLSSLRP